jgi:hypothetical protein
VIKIIGDFLSTEIINCPSDTYLKTLRNILAQSHPFATPAKVGHQLTSVAHTKAESVLALIESAELCSCRWMEPQSTSPTLSRAQHISIAEAARKNDTSEGGQRVSGQKIRHCHVPNLNYKQINYKFYSTQFVLFFGIVLYGTSVRLKLI